MAVSNIKLEDILSCEEIAMVRLKPPENNGFVMGYHAYKNNWTLSVGDEFQGFIEFANKIDKLATAVPKDDGEIISHLPVKTLEKFAKITFYFL